MRLRLTVARKLGRCTVVHGWFVRTPYKKEEPQETPPRDSDSQHDDLEPVNEVFSKDWWKENLLTEGGAYGHMAHPFDDNELTFGDLKKIITDGLGGNLSREDNVTEKLDGQNIMISFKNGKLIAARNKGHLKNKGATAPNTNGIKKIFAGRGNVEKAFVNAMKDLSRAIKAIANPLPEPFRTNTTLMTSMWVS